MVVDSGRPPEPVLGVLPMRQQLTAALAALSLLATPCTAQVASVLSSIQNDPPHAALYDVVNSERQSMIVDAAAVTLLNVHGIKDLPLPPKQYRAYRGPIEIIEVTDEEMQQTLIDQHLAAFTKPPERAGETCTVYTWPLGHVFVWADEVLYIDQVTREKIMAHEVGHCFGLRHPGDDPSVWIAAAAPARNAETATGTPPSRPRRVIAPEQYAQLQRRRLLRMPNIGTENRD